ncbi:DUF2867 domain-containing protein [Oryzibacter oryziterrae]|uniref:DUF2867 domain-containing protein n=1 Tax=Oryzibacter oryziterrae TaxID=2766474 RepID=UPI001F3A7787|nr:DUF2867 domain-containing protein [Oryzibacter oryziterrae]
MTSVTPIEPDASVVAVLPGFTFADSYRTTVDEAVLTAPEAARRSFARSPAWFRKLLALRNRLGAFVGLKVAGSTNAPGARRDYGNFPVVAETANRVILGFNDKHLDFRIVIDANPAADHTDVSVSTVVKTHNLLGRTYLALVLPFHRLIVPTMVRRIPISD